MLNVNKNNQSHSHRNKQIIKQNQLQFSNLKEVDYVVQNYLEFVTLPPQIPIPLNQNFLYCFSITIQRISFLDVLSKSGDPGFLLRSFWWGQNNGYLHRLIEKSEQNQENQYEKSKQFLNTQNLKNKAKNQFQPIKFLVCCPLQNFFSYIFDMKVLKLQLLQPQLKKIIAKTYINFSILKGWQGEKLSTTLDVNLSNGKRAGQMIVDLQIFKIQNPYNNQRGLIKNELNNGIDYSNNLLKEHCIDQSENVHGSRQKKRNNSSTSKQRMNSRESQKSQVKRMRSNDNYERSSIRQQSYQQNQESRDYVYQMQQIDNGYQDKQLQKRGSIQTQNHRFPEKSRNKEKQTNIYKDSTNLNNLYQNQQVQAKNRYNFQSEMFHLHQDFQLLFCNGNKNIDFTQGKSQKIQFCLKLEYQNLLKQKEEVHISDRFNVIFPVLRKVFGKSQVQYNQYNFLGEGIAKVQINPAKHTQKQLENYLKNSYIQVTLTQEQIISKDNKKQSTNAKHYSNKIPLYKLLSYQGSQIPVTLQSNAQKNNVGKKGNQVICFIKVIGQRQTSEQKDYNKQEKITQNQSKSLQNQFVWIKLMQFIPLQLSYFTNSNIFVRIMPKFQNKNNQLPASVIQSKTLWNAFADFSKSQTKFLPRANFNQMLTFPISQYKKCQNQNQQNNRISLQIWDKQKKTLLVGYGIIEMNQNSNRRQIEIYDTKQTVGYLTIWIEKGDITYINNLISTHIQPNTNRQKNKRANSKSQMKNDSIHETSNKQRSQNLNNKTSQHHQEHQENEQSINNQSQSQQSLQENQNNSQIHHNYEEEENQIKNINVRPHQKNFNKLLRERSILQIHNIIYFKLMILSEANNNKNYQIQNQINYDNLEDELSLKQFTQIIKFTLKSTNENGLNNTARIIFSDVGGEEISLWIEKICSCYGFVDESSRYLINWKQFHDGFQAYQVYYGNIIQQRDILLRSILQQLQNSGISINDLQSKFKLISKTKLYQKLSQILSLKLGQNIRFHYPKLKKIQELCDQLRKFQVYETTNQKYVQTEVLREHIITQIRQILQLQAYQKDRDILMIMKKEGIQLSKWEQMNLNDLEKQNNKKELSQENDFRRGQSAYGKVHQNQNQNQNQNQIINKSPTFGFLQPYNNQSSQKQQLINTYPKTYNPSIIKNLPKKETELNLIESNQNFNDSDTFRKRIQTISPINHVSSSDEGKCQGMKIIFSNIDGIVQWIEIDQHTFYPDIGNKNFIGNFEQPSAQNNMQNMSQSYSELHMQNEQISIFNIKKQFQYQVYICLATDQQNNQSVSKQISSIVANKQQILIECVHGQWQGIIDNEGNYRGCLKIC